MLLQLPKRILDLSSRRPLIMGIVNVNDDSFSGDGTLDISKAIEIASSQIRHGADIIDIGAESAGTNREAITVKEEISRFSAFLKEWEKQYYLLEPKDGTQIWPPVVSINSWRSDVIEHILAKHPVELVNDISALPDATNANICAKYQCALLIMHSIGIPKIPNTTQDYQDLWPELVSFFEEKISLAEAAGLRKEQIIIDPGIDFAKQLQHNLSILKHSKRLLDFGRPLLLPISRKTVIGEVLELDNASERDAGTIACLVQGQQQGAHIFRVHNVNATWQNLALLDAIAYREPTQKCSV